MTTEQQIDEAINAVLKASGLSTKHFTAPKQIEAMREAMRQVMVDAYIKGSNDNFKAMEVSRRPTNHPSRALKSSPRSEA